MQDILVDVSPDEEDHDSPAESEDDDSEDEESESEGSDEEESDEESDEGVCSSHRRL